MSRNGSRVDDDELSEGDEDFEAEIEDDAQDDSDSSPKKSNKRRKATFVDDAASEEDEEQEEEEDAGAKRKPRKRNKFIDDIAAVDDEDEEDEDEDDGDDFFGEEAAEADLAQGEVRQAIQAANKINREAEDINPEELERYIKERFEAPAQQYTAGSDFNEQTGDVVQQGLMPTHQDPKLWLVETRTGQEREACIRMMQKTIDLQTLGTPLAIKSCFVQDHLQGYMYIEAFKEAHVREAIRGLRNVLVSKGVRLVPLNEMVDAINVNTKAKKAIDIGSWVRMKRYPYQGDLAKVIDVEVPTQRAEIKFVPRLDYIEMGQKLNAASLNEDGTQKKKGAKKQAGVRLPARAFSRQEAERQGLQPYAKTNFGKRVILPGVGTEYEDGYEVKWISMRNIILDDVGPSVEELTRYNHVAAAGKHREDGVAADDNTELLGSLTNADVIKFVKGDKVKVIGGDLVGLFGYVHAVREDNIVEVMPQLDELTEVLALLPSQIVKTFEVGDHVNVTGGQHSGQTGMVVRTDDKLCTLVSDTTKQELNCFTKDLSENAEVAMGLDSFGKYELHDLVVLDQQTTGIIVGVEKDTCRVLTTESTADNPKVRICRQPDIKRKFPESRNISAPDANGNSVSCSDIVTIKDGRYAGRTGTVKFVVRGSVFIQSREVSQFSGFLCLRSRAVVVKGGKAPGSSGMGRIDVSRLLRSPASHQFSEMTGNGGPVLASPMRNNDFGGGFGGRGGGGSRGGPAGFSGRGMGRQDRIVGKSITIAKGPYKGYKGRIVSATETHVRMELEAQYKTVTVPRTVLPMAEGGVPESAGNRRPASYDAPQTPGYNAGNRTPGYAAGDRTPMHAWGSRTPQHPGMTPSHPGSATPMHDSAWAAGPTPRHPSMDEEPADRYRDMGTPFTPAETPGGLMGTPGLDAGTPSFGYGDAGTPGLDTQTPGTVDPYQHGMGAPTPGIGMTPAFTESSGIQSESSRARFYVGLMVTVPQLGGQPGIVTSVDIEGHLLVELGTFTADQGIVLTPGDSRTMNLGEVQPLRPRKGDRLRILEGNEAGSEGTLSSIAEHEGVVKLADNAVQQHEDVVVVNMTSVGRLQA